MRRRSEQSRWLFTPNQLGIFVLAPLVCFFSNASLWSQDKVEFASAKYSDTLSTDGWGDEAVYGIEIIKLERWIRRNTKQLSDPILLREVARLKKEAEVFAAGGDFTMAIILVETIWDLLLPEHSIDVPLFEEEAEFSNGFSRGSTDASTRKLTWSRELLTGVDIWRQQFEFAFIQEDSTFIESSGNPFTGVRINLNYDAGPRKSVHGYTSFKYSRDYLTGEANLRLLNPIGQSSFWRLEDRFEVNSFYGDIELKYLQNNTELGLSFDGVGPFTIEFEDELLVRRYDNQSGSNPNYLNNIFRAFLKLDTGIASFVGAGYHNTHRTHPNHAEFDYRENRLDFSWYQTVGRALSFSVENELRFRDYTSVTFDEILQDYWENYLRSEIRLFFTSSFGAEIQGSLTDRDYKFLNGNSLPDYRLWEIEPELFLRLGAKWRVSGGLFVSEQTYQNLTNRVATDLVDAAISIPFENNRTYGPTFAIEFFDVDGIMFTLREAYHSQRYPNSPTSDFTRSNPYSDRNVNSVMLFLSWNISSRWRFSALANVDHDRSRRDDSGDFQNTIVGLELDYLF